MKINIPENQVTLEQLKADLESQFPQYSFRQKTKKLLIGKKTGSIGANILLRKSKIIINGTFPTTGGMMLFMLCIILLGVLIPLIVYLAAFQGKMRTFETELGTFVMGKYGVSR